MVRKVKALYAARAARFARADQTGAYHDHRPVSHVPHSGSLFEAAIAWGVAWTLWERSFSSVRLPGAAWEQIRNGLGSDI